MYHDDTLYSYNSDGETTHGSINFQQESTTHMNRLDDGTFEITDTLPKKEYYMSLRKNSKSPAGSLSRLGTGSTAVFGTMSGTLRSGYVPTKRESIAEYKPSGKYMDCVIVKLDGSEEVINVDRESYGQHLFEYICESLELNERKYFGITYKDKNKICFWLDLDKKITKQVSANNLLFEFQVKFYPPCVDMIVEELTRYYFGLQIRQDLITGELPCSFNVYALLGAYVIQSEAGDHDPRNHKGIEYLRNQPLAPSNIQTDELMYRVCELHKQHRGQSPEEADKLFLENARRLSLYGVDRHKVKNSDREDLIIGVNHAGILVYRGKIRVLRFSWARLINVSYSKKKVVIKVRGVTQSDPKKELTFKSLDVSMAKKLYKAVVEHHFFFRMIEIEAPRKPNLQAGFATRKYYKQSEEVSLAGSTDFPFERQPGPKTKRLPPVRKEQSEDGWFTMPSKHGSIIKSGTPNHLKSTEDSSDHFPKLTKSNNIGPNQENIRPMLPPLQWRMSPADCSLSLGMDEKGLDVASQPNTGWQGCRSNKGVKAPGEYFYETHILENGFVRLGWSSNDGSLDLGTDDKGYGYGVDHAELGWNERSKGRVVHANKSNEYGIGVYIGDYIGSRINLNNGDVAWYKNGKPMNVAFKIPEQMRREAVYPALSLKDGRVEINFGDTAFHCPPSDSEHWIPVCQAGEMSQVPNKHTGWKLNAYDATNGIDVSADGLMAQSQFNKGWQGSKCNKGVKSRGKYYFEACSMEDGGLARVGWATDFGSLDLGTDSMGFGYGADLEGFGLSGNQGKKMFKNDIENYGKAIKKDDIIGCFLNLDNGSVQWSLNGETFGSAYDIPLELRNSPSAFFPTVSLKNNTIDLNFGEKAFKYYPGNDWIPLTFAPEQVVKESRKRGPERKVRGLSYLNSEYHDDFNNLDVAREISCVYTAPMSVPANVLPEIVDNKENGYESCVFSTTGSRTVTNGEMTEVATDKPMVETETYYDEDGNLVRRTVTKTKKITKTTKTMSESVSERSENDVATTNTAKFNKRVSVIREDDFDEDELRNAIMSVTTLDNGASVLNDQLGSLGFSSNANKSPEKSSDNKV